jgi:hypothetical protein
MFKKKKRRTSNISKIPAFMNIFLIFFAAKMQFSTSSKLNNEKSLFFVDSFLS